MCAAGVVEGWSPEYYLSEYQCVLDFLSDSLEARLIDGIHWCKDDQYPYHDNHIMVPEA